jgi:hypothetical protein
VPHIASHRLLQHHSCSGLAVATSADRAQLGHSRPQEGTNLLLDHPPRPYTHEGSPARTVDSPECPFYLWVTESANHLFAACPRLAELWESLLPSFAPLGSPLGCAEALAEQFRGSPLTIGHTVALAVLQAIWKSRNKMVFDVASLSTRGVASLIS